MANKDYFDRIADALEIISGDNSHVDDVDKNMDYYKRIAEALQIIAEKGSGTTANPIIFVDYTVSDGDDETMTLQATWHEIAEALRTEHLVVIRSLNNEVDFYYCDMLPVLNAQSQSSKYFVTALNSDGKPLIFKTDSASGFPVCVFEEA